MNEWAHCRKATCQRDDDPMTDRGGNAMKKGAPRSPLRGVAAPPGGRFHLGAAMKKALPPSFAAGLCYALQSIWRRLKANFNTKKS
ncbi:hypothetical protein V8Z74_00965 [Comamonas sp. w2-DMI]|uniref:hypothetical protein n=1 Tax=Comamonas sp. w2-DMI TaxID=3126391 RepID=UPI0032E3B455